jgi:hypothetical protein
VSTTGLIAYCTRFVALPTAVEVAGRARGLRRSALLGLVVLELAGVVVAGIGLLVLAFNGHVQGPGERPGHTIGAAVPVLGLGVTLIASPWLSLLNRRR